MCAALLRTCPPSRTVITSASGLTIGKNDFSGRFCHWTTSPMIPLGDVRDRVVAEIDAERRDEIMLDV